MKAEVDIDITLPPEFIAKATQRIEDVAALTYAELYDTVEMQLYRAAVAGYQAGLQARVMQVIEGAKDE